eukprot:5088799-Pyramimonas_sp.AAC.1
MPSSEVHTCPLGVRDPLLQRAAPWLSHLQLQLDLEGIKLHRNARSAVKPAPAKEMSRIESVALYLDGPCRFTRG